MTQRLSAADCFGRRMGHELVAFPTGSSQAVQVVCYTPAMKGLSYEVMMQALSRACSPMHAS